ncbi:unnamed protein product, partial [Iphiclides podalirius]
MERSSDKKESNPIRCYGCGQPGVIRSRCEKCSSGDSAKSSDFSTVTADDPIANSQPMVNIRVVGQSRIVATGIVPVKLGDKEIITEFMVFPGDNTHVPDKKLPFAKSFVLNSELMQVDVSDVSLRENESTELSSDQRATFNKFLRGRKDQFATEGPPTEFNTHKIRAMQKKYVDENRRPAPDYQVEDLVLLKTRGPNDAGKGQTPKFISRRDGPYRVRKVLSATTYELERVGVGRSGRVALSPGRPAGGPAGGPPSPVGAHASYQKDVCIVFLRDSHYFIEVVLSKFCKAYASKLYVDENKEFTNCTSVL